jgi:hypothetical protein
MGACCCTDVIEEETPTIEQRQRQKKGRKGVGVAHGDTRTFKTVDSDGDYVEGAFTDPGDVDTDSDGYDSDEFTSDKISLTHKGEPRRLFKPDYMRKIKFPEEVAEKQRELGTFSYR